MLVHWIFDDFLISNQRGPPKSIALRVFPVFIPKPILWTLYSYGVAHVIRIWNPEVRTKSLTGGQKFRMVPQVPLPHTGSGISILLKEIGDSGFFWI